MNKNMNDTENTNPNITVKIAGIGWRSPRGDELHNVASQELESILNRLGNYTENEQIFILDSLNQEIASYLLEHDMP